MELNQRYNGFVVTHLEKIPEVKGTVYQIKHEKTDATIVYVENPNEEKVFSIGFRTPSKDDSGIFHILEHAVLNGSRKYPLKDPFVELLKGSLQTFLNAMTFSEKTIYPVASMNEVDFSNLMDVYLDAVFFPNVLNNKQIFQQEGWNLKYNESENRYGFEGIVFNEMKGAQSSSQRRFIQGLEAALYPNTPYATNSGGTPLSILDLTWEQLVEAHQTYYHPSNSFIYLYGEMNIEEQLDHLAEYLNEFNYQDISNKLIDLKGDSSLSETVIEFPIAEDEGKKKQAYLGYGTKFSIENKYELLLAFEILDEILLRGNDAPLKKRLLQEGIGKNVFGWFDTSSTMPSFNIGVSQTDEAQKDRFINEISSVLERLVNDGINEATVQAAIASVEFQLREGDFGSSPEGLYYGINATEAWVASRPVFPTFKYEESFSMIKEQLNEKYFENLIEKYLLNNENKTIAVGIPSTEIEKEEYKEEQNKLEQFKATLTEDDIVELIRENEKLVAFQTTIDSEENKRTLPNLKLADISQEPIELPLEKEIENEIEFLYHELETNKLAYYNLYFNVSAISDSELPYYRLFTTLLKELGTSKYTSEQLSQEIAIKVGQISISNQVYAPDIDKAVHKIKVGVRTKESSIKESVSLVNHIMTETIFDDKNKIKETLGRLSSSVKQFLENSGHVAGMMRVNSHSSISGHITEQLEGISFYRFLTNLEENFDGQYENIVEQMENIAHKIFSRKELTVSFTGEKALFNSFKKEILTIDYPISESVKGINEYKPEISKEAFTNSNSVVYVSKGSNLKLVGEEVSGYLSVTNSILNLEYLWEKLRVVGGAYGGGMSLSSSGNIVFYSYRDPNISTTLNTYDKVSDFIQNLELSDLALERFIIGTIAKMDRPMNARMKGNASDANHFQLISEAKRKQRRKEILTTTLNDIKMTSEIFNKLRSLESTCVIGNGRIIEENSAEFDYKESLFK
ncbi:peptidase M16 inactive domain protein [Marinilactibacillus psychrotolerans]|uniref:insulinase family protein n=1 Tax=Marinilactibacillus psychrotolerans TaxID=191770 RepID=UPI001C7DAB89|nr:insulinase family protein [Marinilactibacillus psychrotolerans]GEQ33715.1 peptidase M16 inactive domain protein [Marinilactibacillus psychrotolerans]